MTQLCGITSAECAEVCHGIGQPTRRKYGLRWRRTLGLILIFLLSAVWANAQRLDPKCSDRNAQGQITCVINEPLVTTHESTYPMVVFAPGDIVEVTADGCVQTGGHGNTWKRYVNPSGPNSDHLYHGLIRIPTGTENSALVRIEKEIGRQIHVTGAGVPVSSLFLHLGYEDDDYSDNGYSSHDDGTEDQCKTRPGLYGGPARVTITIFRGVGGQAPQSNFNFDVLSSAVDTNGLPLNPFWSWQLRQQNIGQIPNTSLCHNFSTRGSTAGVPDLFLSPSLSDCTDQADLSTVDQPNEINAAICQVGGLVTSDSFAGHVNWFPVTVEGQAGWGDHGWQDDDYTFTYNSSLPGNPLSINGRPGLHVEFDSDETIDHFNSPEWNLFHQAVDGGDKSLAEKYFDGQTILTGMFSVDGEHGMKAELHPLFALATNRANFENNTLDEVWLMFVRNRGDEGFCSSQLWDSGLEDYTFRLHWISGMTGVQVNWSKTQFEGTDGTSGPVVSVIQPPSPDAGVYVTFHLGPATSEPFIDGALHLEWAGTPVATTRTAVAGERLAPTIRTMPAVIATRPEEDDEVEKMIEASLSRLPLATQQQIRKARATVATLRPVMHRLPPGPPAQIITTRPQVRRAIRLHAIKAGPATRKLQRDAAVIHALCSATNNAPAGLPAKVCMPSNVRDHR